MLNTEKVIRRRKDKTATIMIKNEENMKASGAPVSTFARPSKEGNLKFLSTLRIQKTKTGEDLVALSANIPHLESTYNYG